MDNNKTGNRRFVDVMMARAQQMRRGLIGLVAIVFLGNSRGVGDKPIRQQELSGRFHGDKTLLAFLIDRSRGSRVDEADIWCKGNAALIALLHPRGRGLRSVDNPKNLPPWRPAWMLGDVFGEKDIPLAKDSLFILVFREEDRRTCVVNVLRGARVFSESPMEQDMTAREVECKELERAADEIKIFGAEIENIKKYLELPGNTDGYGREDGGA